MQARTLGAFMVAAMLAALVAMTGPAAQATPAGPDYETIDIGPRLRALGPGDVPLDLTGPAAADAAAGGGEAGPVYYGEGDIVIGLWNDALTGLYLDYYYVAAVGEHIEVWVNLNLDFPDPADPRNPVVVTQAQIDYLVEEFDTNIYPATTGFFGSPDLHDGTNAVLDDLVGLPPDYFVAADGKDRVIAMISNIGDEHYYDPDYPLFIAGFYWNTIQYYLDRNVISIDAFAWDYLLGPDAAQPYVYEGIFAHEFQHLLHEDRDADESVWFNEGCADFAQYVCGYGHPWGHVIDAMDLPENSLVVWEDQGPLELLADYGRAYLFVLYLFEQLGASFVQSAVYEQANGMAGVDATVAAQGGDRTFAELYRDWAVALLINTDKPGDGRYGFRTLDLRANVGGPDAPNPEAFATPGAPPWGTDYVWLGPTGADTQELVFDGADAYVVPTPWTSYDDALYSGAGDLLDNWAIFATTGGGTLTFDTYYDIEPLWDFGFVQVSTDGGHTWTSLANEYTTTDHDPGAVPTVVENLPGLTGWSGGWLSLSFDLSPYAGQDILIAFRYVTDWAVAFPGWLVDDVRVDGALVSDGTDPSLFLDITQLFPVETDFLVTIVRAKPVGKGYQFQVKDMKLDDLTETGHFGVSEWFEDGWISMMLVTLAAPQDFTKYVDYAWDYVLGDD